MSKTQWNTFATWSSWQYFYVCVLSFTKLIEVITKSKRLNRSQSPSCCNAVLEMDTWDKRNHPLLLHPWLELILPFYCPSFFPCIHYYSLLLLFWKIRKKEKKTSIVYDATMGSPVFTWWWHHYYYHFILFYCNWIQDRSLWKASLRPPWVALHHAHLL